jgi:hypothetical protein
VKTEQPARVLTPEKKSYQLWLNMATTCLSDRFRKKLQGILCQAMDDAYDRGKKDYARNGS